MKDLPNNRINDLRGKKFHYLTVEEYVERPSGKGKVRSSLRNGYTKSCGCLQKDLVTTHGLSHTREYKKAMSVRYAESKELYDSFWTIEMQQELFNMFDCCVNCGSDESLCVDHYYPLSLGYGLSPGNVTVLCQSCNCSKKDKIPLDLDEDFRENLRAAVTKFHTYWYKRGGAIGK